MASARLGRSWEPDSQLGLLRGGAPKVPGSPEPAPSAAPVCLGVRQRET